MSSVPRIFLAGLGNLHLPRTRHSIGHYLIDSLAERLGLKLTLDERLDGYIADSETTLDNRPHHLFLFKARQPMNIQGTAIAKACRTSEAQPESSIIIQDTMKLQPGRIKIKFAGSPDGHRGIRSVNKWLHSDQYFRIQLGIGRSGDAKDFVLGPLSAWEKSHYGVNGEGTDEVWEAVEEAARRMAKMKETPYTWPGQSKGKVVESTIGGLF